MKMNLYGLAQNSYVDGPGIRFAVFFQGCLRHCPGCHNPNSWKIDGGMIVDTEDIKRMMLMDPLLDGVTFSGGEPFLQPDALGELAAYAQSLGLNVWCYSGFTFEELYSSMERQLLTNIDVLVDGAFEKENRSLSLDWRGSSNQRLIDVQKTLKNHGKVVLWNESDGVSEGSAANGSKTESSNGGGTDGEWGRDEQNASAAGWLDRLKWRSRRSD